MVQPNQKARVPSGQQRQPSGDPAARPAHRASEQWEKLTWDFTQERRFLKNVSPKTLEWYKYSFAPFLAGSHPLASGEQLRAALKGAVMALASSKLQPSSVNDYIRCVNAFLQWARAEGHLSESIRLDYLREEQKLIPTLNARQIRRIVDWKPAGFCQRRLHAVCCLLLDTGLRIGEALSLALRVRGKGSKQRLVPFSYECRARLWKFQRQHSFPRLFPTQRGAALRVA